MKLNGLGAVAQWLAPWAPNLWTRVQSWCRYVKRKFHSGHKCPQECKDSFQSVENVDR